MEVKEHMKRTTLAYQQLMETYIESIGSTEVADRLAEVIPPDFLPGVRSYIVRPTGRAWSVEIYLHDYREPWFYRIKKLVFPSKVVAEIMGRYHCKQTVVNDSSLDQSSLSFPPGL